jgi:hypothetical protein
MSKCHGSHPTFSMKLTQLSFHPEMAIFRNLGACPVECEVYSSGVNLRDRLCDVPTYVSAQSLELTRGIHAPRPGGQPDGCPIPLSCGIVLDLANPAMAGLNWKLVLVPIIRRPIYGWARVSIIVGEASRASPKGLARLPNIYNSERYQLSTVSRY